MQQRTTAEKTSPGYEAPEVCTPGSRAEFGLMIRKASVGFEALKTQWRTMIAVATHERMALGQLWSYGPMPMSELASRISLSRAAVTSLVDRLEEDGWLRRVPDSSDRRRTLLHLDADAFQQYLDLASGYDEDLAEWSAEMSDEHWAVICEFLQRWHDLSMRHADELRSTAHERTVE